MDYKVFYRKYRPDSFNAIVGQEYTKTMLQNAIKNNKVSHAYIFTGPRGTGKTSTAKVFAKALNCSNPHDGEACNECNSCTNFAINSDIIEIDAASNNGVDEIRELINNIKISPANSKYKIYIIDEVHMMTQSAFNALLLTLEEPPKHVIFILATTNIESVPITILSRCQRFDFRKFSIEDLVKQIKFVCEQESIEISEEAAEEIAYISEGGMRDALSLLDQLTSNSNKIVIENILSNYGSISSSFIKRVVTNLLNNNIQELINHFDELKKGSTDYKIFIKKLIQELMNLAIKDKCTHSVSRLSYEQLKKLIFDLNDCMNRTNININPYLLIELTMLSFIDSNNISVSVEQSEEKVNTIENIPDNTINIKEENITKIDIDTNEDMKKNQEIMPDIKEDLLNYLKEIRINNCFVGAKKELLNELKSLWPEIPNSPIPDDIIALLIDSNLVAASDDIGVISAKLPSGAMLINRRIDEITDYLCELFEKELKFIALSDEEWQKEKAVYVSNLKKGVTYEFKKEVENIEVSSEILEPTMEEIAQNLFDSDKIEIN